MMLPISPSEPLPDTIPPVADLREISGSSPYSQIDDSTRPILHADSRRMIAFAALRALVAASHEAAGE